MNDYNIVGLYDHNIKSYNKIKYGLKNNNVVSIIHATGTGKSYNALQLVYDNQDKKVLYVVPSRSIIEHVNEIIDENKNLDRKRDFSNLEFRTYQSLVNLTTTELRGLDVDILVLDEFHHIGAPIWGSRINEIVRSHKDIKILGMSAYTVRDRGSVYERDMIAENELFSNSVVSRYDLCDAMIDGVLPKPIYKSAYIYLQKTYDLLEKRVLNNTNDKDLLALMKDAKKRMHDAYGVSDVFKENIKPNGKYIYFCPIEVEDGKNDIKSIVNETKKWLKEMGLEKKDYEIYISTSQMGDLGAVNRKAFYNDEDLYGKKVDHKLRIMFAINQYNEGVHAPGLDGVIMARETKSDIVFFEQLGRALSARGDTKKKYENLSKKTTIELIEMAKERKILLNDKISKKEIIEKLMAPVIIDLANNIEYIKSLENDLGNRIKEVKTFKNSHKRKICVGNSSFDINMFNEDLFEILKYVETRLCMTWMDKYNLAKAYYEHYGNLEIKASFKTINGYEYDENGISLGRWIGVQRQTYNGNIGCIMNDERKSLLDKIGMRFDILDKGDQWSYKYNLAKSYYEHYGNLKVPRNFKTKNGYEYDEDGINLYTWLNTQRQAYRGNGKMRLSADQVNLLNDIKLNLGRVDRKKQWLDKYNLAKAYYEHYGNLDVAPHFMTLNGYEYDSNGIDLYNWINVQRQAYRGTGKKQIDDDQIKLLKDIKVNFETVDREEQWLSKYKLAKAYYEHHGNLNIRSDFKTKNGYEYDKDGIALGNWIRSQHSAYFGRCQGHITDEEIKLLRKIGMKFESHKGRWMNRYNLAKAYYEHYGNLNIKSDFKTKNGYEYDEDGVKLGGWIVTQRQAYKGAGDYKLDENQIKLLNDLKFDWLSYDIDYKLQHEKITAKNREKKNKEILNRLRNTLLQYDTSTLPTKEELNDKIIDDLNVTNHK